MEITIQKVEKLNEIEKNKVYNITVWALKW